MIKEIKIKNNLIMVNRNHGESYKSKKGVIIIEDENGTKYLLDIESNTDISSSSYIEILDTKKTKEKVLFKNILFDTERLEQLAKGGK